MRKTERNQEKMRYILKKVKKGVDKSRQNVYNTILSA